MVRRHLDRPTRCTKLDWAVAYSYAATAPARGRIEIKRRRISPIKPQFLCSLKSAGKGSEIWRIQVKHLVVRFDRIPLRLPRC